MSTKNESNEIKNLSAGDSGVLYSFAVISVLLVSIIFSTVMVMLSRGNESVFKSDAVIIINFILGPIAILLAIGVLRLRRKAPIIEALDVKSFDKYSLLATAMIFLGLTFGLAEVNNLFVGFLQKIGLSVSAPSLPKLTFGGVFASVLFVCIVPAVVEETLFRGLILSGLKSTGTVFAVILSGVLFSLFHMSPAQTIYQFIVGAVYALVILYGKNILNTIGMHLLNNLYIVLNYYFWGFTLSGILKPIITIIGILLLVGGIVLLVLKGEKPQKRQGEKESRVNFILGAILGVIASVAMWISALIG